MEDVFWTYRTRIPARAGTGGQKISLAIEGVDYKFRVSLDGHVLHEQEGMYTPCELDLTGRLSQDSDLTIVVWPVPKSRAQPIDRAQADHCCKPAVSYGWDFHPRLIPSGIWKEVRLETRAAAQLKAAEIFYELSDDLSSAQIHLRGDHDGSATGLRLAWSIIDPEGNPQAETTANLTEKVFDLSASLANPRLWWPHTHGRPLRYRAQVRLLDAKDQLLDSRELFFGLRRIRLVMPDGKWEELDASFPKTRCRPPMTLEVNGRAIFAKGSNLVASHIFPGLITSEDNETLVRLATEANLNLVRLWGGAATPADSFFEACDREGLMVWAEFPLSCNAYPDDPAYLRILDQESKSLIRALRPHGSVVIWCGGNELFNSWSRMNDQSLALRLLNRNCYDLDPTRPFLPTSPVMGVGHGGYTFVDPSNGKEIWQVFQDSENSAYAEFGVGGAAPPETLREIIPPHALFPPRVGTAWETHSALKAWDADPTTWLQLPTIERYFGAPTTLEDLVARSQLLQAEGLRGAFEESRRQWPRCSMALNWNFNEPWPCAANGSLLGWPFRPKPAHAAVAQACRATLASARIPKFGWQPGENFTAELWLLHDAFTNLPPLSIRALLRINHQVIDLADWNTGRIESQANLAGITVSAVLPSPGTGLFTLELHVDGHNDYSSTYTLCFLPAAIKS